MDLVFGIQGQTFAVDVSVVHADLSTRPATWETRLVQVSGDIARDGVGQALAGFVRAASGGAASNGLEDPSTRQLNDMERGAMGSPAFDTRSGKASHTDPLGIRARLDRMANVKLRRYGGEVTVMPRGLGPRRATVVPFVVSAGGVLHEQASELVTRIAISEKSREKCGLRGRHAADARRMLLGVIGRVVAIGSMLIMRERTSAAE